MPTPAEIIAARVNGTYNETTDVISDSEDTYSINDDDTLVSSTPSIADESAFPTLGGGKKSVQSSSAPSWGPSMKSPQVVSTPALSSSSKVSASSPKFKTSTIQEAFSLDVQDQVNVTKPEFIKILTAIKTQTKTNIECTTSQQTQKRTFLISGRPDEVKIAKRLVVRKLTKPVTIVFSVPAKIRSRIIGVQGKNLKPIIQANEVRVDIGNVEDDASEDSDVDEDDVFVTTVKITIEGDVEGCKHAKQQIMAIVKEETKNLSVRIKVDDFVKPFVTEAVASIVEKYSNLDISLPDYKSSSSTILIVGDREVALQAKTEIKEALVILATKITISEVPIPKLKHQFLPIDLVFEKENVLIQLPTEPEAQVQFVGEKKNIKAAQELARQITSQYKVEVLDMSKAHKGNLQHVKAVAALLNKNGIFKTIASENELTIVVPDLKTLSNQELTSIPIEIVSKGEDAEKVKSAKKSIVQVVNKVTPDQTLVIEDIDEFFIKKVPETIKEIAKSKNVEFIILGNVVTLFTCPSNVESEDFDFEDNSEDTTNLSEVNAALDQLRESAKSLETAVVAVPEEDQHHIIGPKGTTLKSIMSLVEPNSVVLKLNTPNPESISIHGLKSQVAIVQKEVANVIAESKDYKDGYKTTVSVPSHILSRLIGKSGAHMNALRDEFGVKIDVSDEGRDAIETKDKNSKTEIVIAGIKRNAEEASVRIGQLSRKWADETLARVKIEHQFHRRLIGPSGVYISRLQDKYNVRIRFPSSGDSALSSFADDPKSKDEVTIKGSSKDVAKAEEELVDFYKFEKENGFKETIQIPSKAIARVIGKAGVTINDIADGTGVEYKFNRDGDSEATLGYAEVELTGSKSALKDAIKKIDDIVQEVENFISVTIAVDAKYHRDLIGSHGSVMKEIIAKAGGEDLPRNRYFRLLSIPNEGNGSTDVTSEGPKEIVENVIQQIKDLVALKEASVSQDYDLAKEKHKLIIGPSGSIRQALQSEFGVTIDIPRANEESTIIKLNGLPEQISAIIPKIELLTKDDWNTSIDVPEAYHALVSEKGAFIKKVQNDLNVEVLHGLLIRKASKLSRTPIPTPPQEAYPAEDASTNFVIVDGAVVEGGDAVIPWRLKGDAKNTAAVAKLIEERLALAKSATSVGWYYSKNPSSFSKVVGPQGLKVNQIRKKTGTFITIPRSTDNNANFIYLVGSADNLALAKLEIENLLK